MAIVLQCPNCQTNVYPQAEWLGKKARCRKCKNTFVLELPKQSAQPTQQTQPAQQTQQTESARPTRSARPAQPKQAETPKSASTEEILNAIQSQITPVPSTLAYKLALVLVSFVMMLLPLIYLGLVIGLAAGAVAYGYYGLAIFELNAAKSRRGGGALLAAYVGPLVASAVAVVFMFKPFFAGAGHSSKPRSLDRKSEPLLFAFVERLCHSVHAPVPKRIDIDAEVNASASFRNGFLSLFRPNDLVLTIGMPLVSGLTLRELGGVLAHEFGHFSQGMGMRLNYVVRSINHWFARVVYERDALDEWLADTAQGLDLRISWVLYFAMFMVWLTRRILWLFMLIGHACSCWLMRQMEYDADLHEIRFAGSSAFQSTSGKLRRLGFAYQQSIEELQNFFMDGKLVNNIPRLVQLNRDGLSKTQQQEIEKGLEEEKPGWFDTHPIDKDRVAVAQKVADEGVFRLEAPASVLFKDFDSQCKQVSKDFFQGVFEDEFHDNMLVDVEHLLSFKESSLEATQACKRFFGIHFLVPRMIAFASPTNRGIAEKSTTEQLKKMRQFMIDRLATYDRQSKVFDNADTKWLLCHQAMAVHNMELKLDAKDWPDIPVKTRQETAEAAEHHRKTLASLHDHLAQFETAFSQRVDAAVQWLFAKSQSVDHVTRVLRSMSVLQQNYPQMVTLRNDMAAISTLIHFAKANEFTKTQATAFENYGTRINQNIVGLLQQFIGTSYPFEHAKGQIDLATYFVPKALAADDIAEVLMSTEQMLANYHALYFRSIGVLASIVQNVESQLGLPPQADPEEENVEESADCSSLPNDELSLAELQESLPPLESSTFANLPTAPSAYSELSPAAFSQAPPLPAPAQSASSGWSMKLILIVAAVVTIPILLLVGVSVIVLLYAFVNDVPGERGRMLSQNKQLNSIPRPPSFSRPNAPTNPNNSANSGAPNPPQTMPGTQRPSLPNPSIPGRPNPGRPNNIPFGNMPMSNGQIDNPESVASPQNSKPNIGVPSNPLVRQTPAALPTLEQNLAELKQAGLTPKAWMPMSRLMNTEVVEEKRSELLNIVREHLQFDRKTRTPNAWVVFSRWADVSCEKELVAALEPHGKLSPPDARSVLEALGRIGNPEHIETFVGYLGDTWCQDSAKDVLGRFGSKAEDSLLKYLTDSREPRDQRQIAQVLQKCGTSKSIPILENLTKSKDVFLSRDAQAAMKEIRKRESQ